MWFPLFLVLGVLYVLEAQLLIDIDYMQPSVAGGGYVYLQHVFLI